MKGDIILKITISFLIPFIMLYAFSCFFYLKDIGVLAILNCSISALISYILFYLRFGKINPLKLISIKKISILFLFVLFSFIYYLLTVLII